MLLSSPSSGEVGGWPCCDVPVGECSILEKWVGFGGEGFGCQFLGIIIFVPKIDIC